MKNERNQILILIGIILTFFAFMGGLMLGIILNYL